MQMAQELAQSNQRVMQEMQGNEVFKDLMDRYLQNLNMAVMQQQNKQIGRTGVKPAAMG